MHCTGCAYFWAIVVMVVMVLVVGLILVAFKKRACYLLNKRMHTWFVPLNWYCYPLWTKVKTSSCLGRRTLPGRCPRQTAKAVCECGGHNDIFPIRQLSAPSPLRPHCFSAISTSMRLRYDDQSCRRAAAAVPRRPGAEPTVELKCQYFGDCLPSQQYFTKWSETYTTSLTV